MKENADRLTLLSDFVPLLRSDGDEAGLSGARVSVPSHLIAFAAEKSRLESRVISMID
ncbi:hypothetical protein [Paenibacillus phytorum]|uniref:hypothetical protein n=1 Tax=Paenibacillus phytorum TaxID=2654977 RepID=UPI00149160BC|nr:hypothetical protein [Paenibacillus phytorum]